MALNGLNGNESRETERRIDVNKLEKVKQKGDRIIARCPACAESGADRTGNHLIVYPRGAYGCVVNKGDELHSKRIWELAGGSDSDGGGIVFKTIRPKAISTQKSHAAEKPKPLDELIKSQESRIHGFLKSSRYEYRPDFVVVRFDFEENGEPDKTFRPFVRVGDGWIAKNLESNRPLFHLDQLKERTSEVVYFVEGEKCACALAELGYLTTSAQGGANAQPEKTDFSPLKGRNVIIFSDNDEPGKKHAQSVADHIATIAASVRILELAGLPEKGDIADWLEQRDALEPDDIRTEFEAIVNAEEIDAELEAVAFDDDNEPPDEPAIYELAGESIATAGNIELVAAQSKSGKTAWTGALIASSMRPGDEYLGLRCNAAMGVVLHFDTEQSRKHHWRCINNAKRRATVHRKPEWLHSYRIKSFSLQKRVEKVFKSIERTARRGTIRCVIIDGVGDLVSSVNNEEECIALVDRLMQYAERFQTVIFCVLHENKAAQDAFKKARGHLGSELERRAETVISLEKDKDGVTTVFAETARNGAVPKDKGPRFAWDPETAMHQPVNSVAESRRDARTESLRDTVIEVYRDAKPGGVTRTEFIAAICKLENLKPEGARTRYDKIKAAKLIKETTGGLWISTF